MTRMIKTDDGFSFSIGPLEREGGRRLRVIDFFDSENRRIQFTSDRGPRSTGAAVPVVYLRDRPHIAVVGPALRNVTSLLFLTMVGLVFLAVGVAGFLLGVPFS